MPGGEQSSKDAVWLRRALLGAGAAGLAALGYHRFVPRSPALPLITEIDGPAPASATGVVIYLHGLSQTIRQARRIVPRLRDAGLPSDYAIVLFEAPFGTWFGQSWGLTVEDQATSRARLRARIRDLLGDTGPPAARVVISGFSQGAGLAIDTAVEEPRIGALGSFAPCLSVLRGELSKRDLRVLLAHGSRDERCPVEESRSLARVLEAAHKPPRFIEFDGVHEVPTEAVQALVELATEA